jgi:hypothetical protein
MKNETQTPTNLAPRQERAILDEIRNDHELIARLSITPQELEALSKCALLGTLTCKQDMLFILRQIREATGASFDHANLFPGPAFPVAMPEDDPAVPDIHQVRSRIIPAIGLESNPVTPRRRFPVRFGILFWGALVTVGVIWNSIILISRWRDSFMTTIGSPISAITPGDAWYAHLDRFSVLLTWEALFVVAIVGITYLRSLRGTRRFKVRPGGRLFN